MSLSSPSYILPDAEPSWSLWRSLAAAQGEALNSPSEFDDSGRHVVVGLPATGCRTVGLVLPTVDKTLLPAMIGAQLEKRGIAVEAGASPNYAFHILGQNAVSTVVSVDVLTSPFPENVAVSRAVNYTAALRMKALPQGELTVIEEQGLLILAANHQGKLWHSHVLGMTDSDPADLARELEIARLSLEAQDGFGAVRSALLVGEKLAPLKAELKKHTALEINTTPALKPNAALRVETFQKLLPPAVCEAQAARGRRGFYARVGVLVAILYAVIFTFGWWYLNHLGEKTSSLRKEVASTEAPAAEVQKTHKLWVQMSPAIEVHRYPVVILSQITALMPPSGVLLRRFEAKPTEIELRGDARDAQTATQFFDDLKKHPKLSRYNWNMPVPSVKDKVASFKIQGKLEGEG